MMAYESNNMNNTPYVDPYDCNPFEPSQLVGKLDASNMGGLAAHFQPQFRHNNPQPISFTNMQMQRQMQAQANFMNNNMTRMQTAPVFQQSTMNSMTVQQPFFQPSMMAEQPNLTRRPVPSFVTFNETPRSISSSFNPILNTQKTMEPNRIQSTVHAPAISRPGFSGSFSFEQFSVDEKKASNPPGSLVKPTELVGNMAPRSISKNKRLLPADFQPSGNYVICGNKRKYFESKGNIRFREVCKLFLQEYIQAPTKIEKSAVVSKVMNILREDCPEGAFVSPQGGRWYAVSERTAREKVGTFFRDCLADNYKSSAKNKIARRKIIKKAASVTNANDAQNFSDDGSLESISFYDVDDLTPVPL